MKAEETTDLHSEASTKFAESHDITKRYVLWSAGGGLIPVPILDLATVIGVQIKLVAELSEVYGVAFSENRAKNILYPLITSIGTVPMGVGLVSSLIKTLPVVGQAAGLISLPVVAGAPTYATGRVFIFHFESGGSLLDFDPIKMREHYASEFKTGKDVVKELEKTTPKPAVKTTPAAAAAKKATATKKTATAKKATPDN